MQRPKPLQVSDSSGGMSPKRAAMQKEDDPLKAQSPRCKMELKIDLRRQNIRQTSLKNDRKDKLKNALAWFSDHNVGFSPHDYDHEGSDDEYEDSDARSDESSECNSAKLKGNVGGKAGAEMPSGEDHIVKQRKSDKPNALKECVVGYEHNILKPSLQLSSNSELEARKSTQPAEEDNKPYLHVMERINELEENELLMKTSSANIGRNHKTAPNRQSTKENFAPTSPLNKQSSNIGSRHLLSASQTTTASPPESVIDTDHQLNHCADQHESMDGNDNMQVDELPSEVVEDGSGMSSMKGIVTKAAGDFDKDEGQAPDSKAASMDRNVDISSAVEKTLSTAVNDDTPDKRERRDFYATDMDEHDMQKEKLVQATASGGTQQKSIPPQSAQNSGVGSRHLLSASQTTTASPPESVIDTDHQLNHCADQHESMGGNDNMQIDELPSEIAEDGSGTSSMKGVVTKAAGDFDKDESKAPDSKAASMDLDWDTGVVSAGDVDLETVREASMEERDDAALNSRTQ